MPFDYSKIKIALALILFTALSVSPAHAETHSSHAEDVQALHLSLRIHTILHEMSLQAESDVDARGELSADNWTKRYEDTLAKIAEAYSDAAKIEKPAMRQRVKDGFLWLLKKSNPWNLVRAAVNLGHHVKKAGVKHGPVAAGATALYAALELGTPALLTVAGLPALIPLSVFFPYPPLAYGAAKKIQDRILRARLIKLYGSVEKYEEFEKARKEARAQLKLVGADDVMVRLHTPTSVRVDEGAVLSSSGFFRRWTTEWLGIVPHRLNYGSLDSFIRERKASDHAIDSIRAQKNLPEVYRAALLLHYLTAKDDSTLLDAVKKRFPNSFVKLSPTALAEDRLLEWSGRFVGVKRIDQAIALLAEAPHELPARVVARVWQEAILPNLLEELPQLGMFDSMRLRGAALAARTSADLLGPVDSWSPEMSDTLAKASRAPERVRARPLVPATCHRPYAKLGVVELPRR